MLKHRLRSCRKRLVQDSCRMQGEQQVAGSHSVSGVWGGGMWGGQAGGKRLDAAKGKKQVNMKWAAGGPSWSRPRQTRPRQSRQTRPRQSRQSRPTRLAPNQPASHQHPPGRS